MAVTRKRAVLLTIALWAVLFLPCLGTLELQGEEGRRILPAIDMLHGGNWLVPSVGGEDYYSKPPGINWLVAGAFTLTGQRNEASARLPSVFFTLAFVLLLVGMESPLWPAATRLTAAAIYMTSIAILEKARLIEIEAVYTAITGMAIVWWLNTYARGNQPWRQWIIPCLLLAFGALVKGPFLAGPFYATVFCVLLYANRQPDEDGGPLTLKRRIARLRPLVSLPHIVGGVLILLIAGGWLYLAWRQNAAGMGRTYKGQLGGRFAPRSFSILAWALAVLDSFPKLLPWLVLMPVLWLKPFVANLPERVLPIFKGCRLAMVLGFACLCLIPGLESRYTIPAWPLMAVLLGWMLAAHRTPLATDHIWKYSLLGVLTAVPIGVIVAAPWLGLHPAAISLAVAAALAAAAAWKMRKKIEGGQTLVLLTVGVAAICVVWNFVQLVPYRLQFDTRRTSAAEVNAIVPAGQTLYVYKPGYQSFLFYVREPVRYLVAADQLAPPVRYVLMPRLSPFGGVRRQLGLPGRYLLLPVRHWKNAEVLERLEALGARPLKEIRALPNTDSREARDGRFMLYELDGR